MKYDKERTRAIQGGDKRARDAQNDDHVYGVRTSDEHVQVT